jgi:hypothetical protein
MSKTVEYKGTDAVKATKAIKDCMDWLGDDYQRVMCLLVDALQEGEPEHNLRMGLMMAGIQGYPAQAMIDRAITLSH